MQSTTKTFFGSLFGHEEFQNYDEQRRALASIAVVEKDKDAPPGAKNWQTVSFAVQDKKPLLAGVFRFDSVAELRQLAKNALQEQGYTHVEWNKSHASGDSRNLHSENPGAFFQAASQFNCLEFVGPTVTPERGITCYTNDRTQGPACALACAAATAFRNYLVPVDKDTFSCGERALPDEFTDDKVAAYGQTADLQLNGIAEVEAVIMKEQTGEAIGQRLWQVKNGYIELTAVGNKFLPTLMQSFKEQPHLEAKLIDTVRVGVQFDSEVTDFRITKPEAAVDPSIVIPTVGQVFASACSIGYSRYADEPWEPIAKIALKGAYEATFYAYIIHACRILKRKNSELRPLFLTKLGGGVFSNPTPWICDAMMYSEAKVNELFAELAAKAGADGAQKSFPYPIYLTHFRDIENGYEKYIPK